MFDDGRYTPQRDLSRLVLPDVGQLRDTGNAWEPYQLIGSDGAVVEPVRMFFAELQGAGRSPSTLRSYGMDLLRWFRFLWAEDVRWNHATRVEARDFCRWMALADKPVRSHWRNRAAVGAGHSTEPPVPAHPGVNLVTGKPYPGRKFAASSRAHPETVLRRFYDFHIEEGTGPILNPFPLDRSRGAGRRHAHHNPMDHFKNETQGRYRPRVPKRLPRRIPDELFNALFATLQHHRDRALLAAWVSTGARAQELLDIRQQDADPGQQLIRVTRKGTRAEQLLPASPDFFVWLRLYQQELHRAGVPRGRSQPLWWTLRRPWRPLNYHAARAMLNRTNELLGSNWSLHDLRHTASYRMAEDRELPLTHVQWVLGHTHPSTTEIYLAAGLDDVVREVLAHHTRRALQSERPPKQLAGGYKPESLNVLFGQRP